MKTFKKFKIHLVKMLERRHIRLEWFLFGERQARSNAYDRIFRRKLIEGVDDEDKEK